jgi:flagellar motility protein MotE (MotC chaperone)
MKKSSLLIVIAIAALVFAGTFALGVKVAISQVPIPEPPLPPQMAPMKDVETAAALPTPENLTKVAMEMDTWRAELQSREKKLLEQDQEIIKRQALLKAEREGLDRDRAKILELQKEVEGRLVEVEQNEVAHLEQMATLYSTMKIEDAVGFIRKLPDKEITRLLGYLKTSKVARFWETWSKAYPEDHERLVTLLDQSRMVVQEKAKTAEVTP